jgi:hypothetical protein
MTLNANPLLLGDDGGYSLTRSLRFRQSATAYLSRTYATPTSTTTGTISFWYKRGLVGNSDLVTAFGTVSTTTGNGPYLQFTTNGALRFVDQSSDVITSAFFRDPAAWYHFVLAIDTTQATAANRLKFYVNGVQITSFSSATYGAQNYASNILASGTQYVGYSQPSNARGSDGYLAEVNFIDGQALTPSSFGAYSIYNQWLPKKYAGTYGTNGFYLPFTNNASAATLGNDFSGNGNTWTTNNISVTTGSTYDSTTDVPTLTSATAANYAVISPLWPASYSNGSITNGNLTALITAVSSKNCFASMPLPTSGKIYYELTSTYSGSGMVVGVTATPSGNDFATAGSNVFGYYNANGNKYNNGTGTAYGTAWYTSGQTYTIGVAYDADAGTLVFYLNNTSQGTAFTLTTGVSYFPTAGNVSGSGNNTINWNFGQQPYTYTPPSGYVALNTYNL